MAVVYDYDLLKHEVVQFLEDDRNWDNVVKLLEWENRLFNAHELYNTLTDSHMEGIKGAFEYAEEGAELDYLTIEEYVNAWIDGDF